MLRPAGLARCNWWSRTLAQDKVQTVRVVAVMSRACYSPGLVLVCLCVINSVLISCVQFQKVNDGRVVRVCKYMSNMCVDVRGGPLGSFSIEFRAGIECVGRREVKGS